VGDKNTNTCRCFILSICIGCLDRIFYEFILYFIYVYIFQYKSLWLKFVVSYLFKAIVNIFTYFHPNNYNIFNFHQFVRKCWTWYKIQLGKRKWYYFVFQYLQKFTLYAYGMHSKPIVFMLNTARLITSFIDNLKAEDCKIPKQIKKFLTCVLPSAFNRLLKLAQSWLYSSLKDSTHWLLPPRPLVCIASTVLTYVNWTYMLMTL